MADREQAAGEPGQGRGEHEHRLLVAAHGVAERACPRCVVADGDQHVAERRVDDPPGRPESQEHDRQAGVVEDERVGQVDAEELPRHALQPVLAAGHRPPLVGDEVDHLRERECHHREVDAGAAGGEVADRHGDQRRRQGAREDRDRERHPGPDRDDPGDVRRAAPERGVAEGQQPRVAEQQVERDGEQGPARDVRRDRRVDVPGQPERDGQPDREQPVPHPGRASVGEREQPADHAAASSRPNRPAGRHSSTAAMRMNTSVCDSAGT